MLHLKEMLRLRVMSDWIDMSDLETDRDNTSHESH